MCTFLQAASGSCAMAGDHVLHSALLPCHTGRALGTKHVSPRTALLPPGEAVQLSYIKAGMRRS